MAIAHGSKRKWIWLVLALGAHVAAARSVAGVGMEEQMQWPGGQSLVLCQTGLREVSIFRIHAYVWGLYLDHQIHGVGQAMGRDLSRQLRFNFRHDIGRNDLAAEIRKGLGATTRMQDPEAQRGLNQLIDVLTDVKTGDWLIISYVPGRGTQLSGRVSQPLNIPGKRFSDALLGAWVELNPGAFPLTASRERSTLLLREAAIS